MATSKLQIAIGDLLDKTFPELTIRENYRPDWLMSSNLTLLELDFYIEELNVAIEVQGIQHFEYNGFFFKSHEDFEKRQQYDTEKKDLCDGAKIRLIEICSLLDGIIEIQNIAELAYKELPLGEWSVEGGRPPAHKAIKVKHQHYSAEEKYKKDQRKLALRSDPIATPEQKLAEIKQCKKKLRKFKEAGKVGIPYFDFNYLSLNEQLALLEELGIKIE